MSLPAVIPFVKASACGNDFLLVEASVLDDLLVEADQVQARIAELARRLCDRHEGVGGDGVEWMYPHPTADVEIRLSNADGSSAEISGNGTRCVAAYVCAERQKEQIAILTGAGLKTCVLTGRNGREYEFEIDMGEAAVGAELEINISEGKVRGIPVSMGNPHFVAFVPDFARDWQRKAAAMQRAPDFKKGVNIELVVADGRNDVRARFFERGVGETESSGTGSCAAAVAAMAGRKAESPVRVHALGGTQTVRKEGERVFLRGSARLVCRGEFFLDF
ncbi:MAG: diaminopimelate epimerase [Candidatus Sulfotelmatobacter sp.]